MNRTFLTLIVIGLAAGHHSFAAIAAFGERREDDLIPMIWGRLELRREVEAAVATAIVDNPVGRLLEDLILHLLQDQLRIFLPIWTVEHTCVAETAAVRTSPHDLHHTTARPQYAALLF